MNRNKVFKILINIFTVVAVWLFIAGFVNISNTLTAEKLYFRGIAVEGEVVRYYVRSSPSAHGRCTVYFVCGYTDPKTGNTYFAETATTPNQYAPDIAEKIGKERVGGKINLVISGSLCAVQRDVESGYVSNVLITVLFIAGGVAVIAARVVYELTKDKRKKNMKTAEETVEVSEEAYLY
ncbi:MAG: hypothetical protein K2L42_00040 [Clostridia bacterium]|nr:hypothetical protein [Clostridia bacterium]